MRHMKEDLKEVRSKAKEGKGAKIEYSEESKSGRVWSTWSGDVQSSFPCEIVVRVERTNSRYNFWNAAPQVSAELVGIVDPNYSC